jgi:hypothetical protein
MWLKESPNEHFHRHIHGYLTSHNRYFRAMGNPQSHVLTPTKGVEALYESSRCRPIAPARVQQNDLNLGSAWRQRISSIGERACWNNKCR